MRILQVCFKNLNSLVGEWEIDLTHPAFASDGIFAITGPTGAGKTTILDAICLALYGRTPRLSRVNKGGNELMSRQTGECYAEVTFETQTGRYRCHWSQHRAHKKPDGDLQAPRHEIADADSGRIFEAKIRGVADQIETATGMDFDRFTRSMLLAQGSFAAFLQAGPDERAPILEQITGTEIYSQISIRVHERRSEERKKLDALQAELAGMQLLSAEDERQLSTSLVQKTRQDTELNQQIALKSQAIAWIDGITRLEEDLKLLQLQKQDLYARQEAFAPEQEKLERAAQALELSGEYAALTSIRREQETDRQSLGDCMKSLPALEEAEKQANDAMKTAGGKLDKRKAEQKEASPVIRRVRELDLSIREKNAPIQVAFDTISANEKSLGALRSRQSKDCADLDSKQKTLEGLQKQLDETREDEGLIENLTGIRGQFDALKNIHIQLGSKLKESNEAEDQKAASTRTWKKLAENLETRKRSLDDSQAKLSQKQVELKGILEDRELSDWRNNLSFLTAHISLLAKAGEAARSLAKSRQILDEMGKRHEALVAENSNLTEQLQTQVEKQASLEREMGLLETQLSLLKKIEDFKEARRQLQDGEPCPLCGARKHPFAEGNIPVPDETRQQLGQVRADFKAASDAVAGLKVKQARVGKDIEQVTSSQKEHSEKIAESKDLIRHACSDLPLDAADPDLIEKLERLRNENATKLDHATRIVQTAENVEKEAVGLRESLEKARETVAQAERETQTAFHKKDFAWHLIERLRKEVEALQSEQEKSLNVLRLNVSAYGVKAVSFETLDRIQAQLTARRDQWVSRQKNKSELDQKIIALDSQTRHQAEKIQKSDDEIMKQRELLDGLLREREALSQKRREVFGDKSPEDEEHRLSKAVEVAENDLEAARRKLNAGTQELGKLKSRMEELDQSIKARSAQLNPAEEAFLIRLKGSGFADEENFKAACLREDKRKTLAQQAQKLADEKTELASREKDRTRLLETERQKRVTDHSRDELNQALAMLAADQKALQQEIGGICQKLRDNENLKQKQQERALAIDAQKRESLRWDLLHELIGSADGKKYRNFAQGLTFELMVGHANRQLRKMTDRYLLIRDDAQPLELNVIDNYQAGEVRSTKNLSGGESFIVSLSLALGLSHTASKNVRVDSLFLDEGFGALDEDALDTALETLAGLQQDGKVIGVISHVPALKERIGTRIQVTPQAGGRSLISGPGCGKKASPAKTATISVD